MVKRAVVSDFDGTITTCDTLLAFIRYACGTAAMAWGLALCSPWIVLMKAGLYPNGKAKERLFAHFFQGWTAEHFDAVCQRFAATHTHLLRPKAVATLTEALGRGDLVVVVSASIDRWVAPFFGPWATPAGRVVVLGTQIEVAGGVLTGRFKGANCYGAEKVARLSQVIIPRSEYDVTAFGDSRGDREMIDYADRGYYKPFE